MPAITEPREFGSLLRDIWGYYGTFPTCCALWLSALFGLRPGEIRHLEWSEVDFEAQLIRIPMGKMKARRLHMVPLAPAAIVILRDLHQLTGQGRLCFPGLANKGRPMSENTVNLALRRLGYSGDEATTHGFRSTFSTLAHGSGLWRPEVVEVQWADECERLRQAAAGGSPSPRAA